MPDEKKFEPIEIDINDTSLIEGTALELDLKEDFQARSAPPPRARYWMRLFLDDDKIQKNLKEGFDPKDPNSYYYKKVITCKIQDPKGVWQDSIAYYNVSSGLPRGKKISSMAGVLGMLKVKIPNPISELKLTRLFMKAMKQLDGPKLISECDWSAWDKDNNRRNEMGQVAVIAETGKAANTMLNFPKKADGSYNHIIHTKEGIELVAKLKVLRFITEAEVKSQQDKAKTGSTAGVVSQPKQAAVKPKVEEEVNLDDGLQLMTDDSNGNLNFTDDGEVVLEG
jgi:hypothetical protein